MYHNKVEEKLIGSYKDITHETHKTIFTNSRKRACGNIPGTIQDALFISFMHAFGIIIKTRYSPFNQCMIQQPAYHVY